jgi:hypothetical protein
MTGANRKYHTRCRLPALKSVHECVEVWPAVGVIDEDRHVVALLRLG